MDSLEPYGEHGYWNWIERIIRVYKLAGVENYCTETINQELPTRFFAHSHITITLDNHDGLSNTKGKL